MLMQSIANRLLRRRIGGNPRVVGAERFRMWRDLGIWWSSNVNPVNLVSPQNAWTLPDNLIDDYFPGNTTAFKLSRDGGGSPVEVLVKIDEINATAPKNQNLKDAQEAIARQEFTGLPSLYVQAAHDFVAQGEPLFALRALLNHQRVSVDPPAGGYVQMQVGDCLVDLGKAQTAAQHYIRAAENFLSSREEHNAADAYERAGLAWEAETKSADRPCLTYIGERGITAYNSTTCFRMAKNYAAVVGDYDSSSRCFILERDSHRRFTQSWVRKCELSCMRALWLYGESPLHAILSFLLVWIVFAAAFLFSGFRSGPAIISYDLAWHFDLASVSDFGQALYFSAVTISTLGYGDCSPASTSSMCLAGLEACSGIVLGAMFLVSVQRRYVGR